jgi:4-alpha-glucanotransferase
MADSPARAAGILLHPTSLPGAYGMGDLGPAAFRWIEWLADANQSWWQVLPLGPTGYGDSPYQCFSAFAGNPYLISPERLVEEGLLNAEDVKTVSFPRERVDFVKVIAFKDRLLSRAWESYRAGSTPTLRAPYESFVESQREWLEDYALFIALKKAHGGRDWHAWPAELRERRSDAMVQARRTLADTVHEQQFAQFLFFRQWDRLKEYAEARGVGIIGDIPIFVASDSADVWAHPELFFLDTAGKATVVAGVPPDYFSETGQLWGNPLYRWEAHKRTGYAWWISRLRAVLRMVHLVRLDHFRGFEGYWEIPAGKPTAEIGRWVKGPGIEVFEAARQALGELPLIAENLGVITEEVEALREQLDLPGMRVLQFAFTGPDNAFLPHNHERRTVVYTGTHDNDTTRNWYATAPKSEREFLRKYIGQDPMDVAWTLIRLAWASVADYALAPLQDVLSLGAEGRMNFPGKPVGNWQWRFTPEMLTREIQARLRELTEIYGRAIAPNQADRPTHND